MPLSNLENEYLVEYEAVKRDMAVLAQEGADNNSLRRYAMSTGCLAREARKMIVELINEGLVKRADRVIPIMKGRMTEDPRGMRVRDNQGREHVVQDVEFDDISGSATLLMEDGERINAGAVMIIESAKTAQDEIDVDAIIDQADEETVRRILDDHSVPVQDTDPKTLLKAFVNGGEIQSWELMDGINQGPGESSMKRFAPGETWSMKLAQAFNQWLDTYLEEAQLPYASWEIDTGGPYGTNFIDSDFVIEQIKSAPANEQAQIKDMMVRIDFAAGDMNDFFKHLAESFVKTQGY